MCTSGVCIQLGERFSSRIFPSSSDIYICAHTVSRLVLRSVVDITTAIYFGEYLNVVIND